MFQTRRFVEAVRSRYEMQSCRVAEAVTSCVDDLCATHHSSSRSLSDDSAAAAANVHRNDVGPPCAAPAPAWPLGDPAVERCGNLSCFVPTIRSRVLAYIYTLEYTSARGPDQGVTKGETSQRRDCGVFAVPKGAGTPASGAVIHSGTHPVESSFAVAWHRLGHRHYKRQTATGSSGMA